MTTTEHPESHIYGYDADTRILYLYAEDNGDASVDGYYNFDFRFEMTTNPANFWTFTAKIYFFETCIGLENPVFTFSNPVLTQTTPVGAGLQ